MKTNGLLKKEISIIDGVGSKYAGLLQEEGITSVGRLLDYCPLELSKKVKIPCQNLYDFKRKAELVRESVFDLAVFQTILNWSLDKILETSAIDLASQTGLTGLQIDDLKYHIANLFVALDHTVLKGLLLKDVMTVFPDAKLKEYFIKLQKDSKSVFLHDTPFDPGAENLNIPLFTTDLLTGTARQVIDDVCILWDQKAKKFKAWITARNPGKNQPWEICYSESPDIKTWSAPQLLFRGLSEPRWAGNAPQTISVVKSPGGSYHMWYSAYYCPEWENMINYRSSPDGIKWDAEKLVLRPGGVSDDGQVNAVCLKNGNFRLYYWHQVEDHGPNTTRSADIQNGAPMLIRDISVSPRFILAATVLEKSTHHRIWQCTYGNSNELFMLDSIDEGKNWKETKMGNSGPSEYRQYRITCY